MFRPQTLDANITGTIVKRMNYISAFKGVDELYKYFEVLREFYKYFERVKTKMSPVFLIIFIYSTLSIRLRSHTFGESYHNHTSVPISDIAYLKLKRFVDYGMKCVLIRYTLIYEQLSSLKIIFFIFTGYLLLDL